MPTPTARLTADNHVHSEWSWDADAGSMEASCARALELGLTTIAFTEHWDPTPCQIESAALPHLPPDIRRFVAEDGVFRAPLLDVEGYLACVDGARRRFPQLRILSGVELGEPHWWPEALATLVRQARFDRILGSVHCVDIDGSYQYVDGMYGARAPHEVVRIYLGEVLRLVESSTAFEVLAHIDYPVRAWPTSTGGAYHPSAFQDEYRTVLRALARSGRVLEINTAVPLHAEVVRWWYDEGGKAVSLGSDAHEPTRIASGFAAAAALANSCGFAPDPADPSWLHR
ncbi:MAG: PHP domain-containing protein [Tepidiformaceae bacterium]